MDDLWPPGCENEYEIDLGLGSEDPEAEVKQEILCTVDMRKEVEAMAQKISSEEAEFQAGEKGKMQFDFESKTNLPIRQRLEDVYEFGKVAKGPR